MSYDPAENSFVVNSASVLYMRAFRTDVIFTFFLLVVPSKNRNQTVVLQGMRRQIQLQMPSQLERQMHLLVQRQVMIQIQLQFLLSLAQHHQSQEVLLLQRKHLLIIPPFHKTTVPPRQLESSQLITMLLPVILQQEVLELAFQVIPLRM